MLLSNESAISQTAKSTSQQDFMETWRIVATNAYKQPH